MSKAFKVKLHIERFLLSDISEIHKMRLISLLDNYTIDWDILSPNIHIELYGKHINRPKVSVASDRIFVDGLFYYVPVFHLWVMLDIEVIDGVVLKHFRVTTTDGELDSNCDKSILKVIADNFRLNSKISENITWNVELDSKEELEQELSNISELFIKNGIVTFSEGL